MVVDGLIIWLSDYLVSLLSPRASGKHFVDSHRAALIQRVTSVNAIMDDLLGEGVLNEEKYSEVNAEKMRQEKMRKLYDVISAGGPKGKDVFYTSLQKHEAFLMNDLKG